MKRIVLSIFALLLTTFSWGQTSLSGNGTADSPYIISNASDWNTFANETNAATYWTSGVYTRLDADISVSTMVGTSSNKYRGSFDGNWHTLALNLSSNNTESVAPFSYIQSASIKNIKISGSVTTSSKYAGSIVGSAYGNNAITSCTSEATINISTNGDASTGGLAGRVLENGGVLSFNNCSFEGSIIGASAQKCAGFVGWVAGTVSYTNCLMAGTITVNGNTSTFNRKATGGVATTENAYYITSYNGLSGNTYQGPDGSPAPTLAPTTEIGKKYTKADTDYYIPGAAVITGLGTTTYSYTGNDIVITPTLTYYGWTMTEGINYEISYEKQNGEIWESASVINAAGDYRIIISGIGDDYAGSFTSTTIHVVSYNTWAALQEVLADASQGDRNITLSADLFPENPTGEDVALEVNGTVVLNLNGKTIDRGLTEAVVKGQVFRVNSDANLTINGPGTIEGGYNKAVDDDEHGVFNEGGGIYNMGTLVLNNVDITNNTCVKKTENSTASTARGGGIYSGNGSSLTINGGSISQNKSGGGGGGVYIYKTKFSMEGVLVSNNESESKGGGIRVDNPKTASIKSCTISSNIVTMSASNGGGIHMEGSSCTLYMEDCSIEYNSSRLQGCGFYQLSGTTYAKNCHFDHNYYTIEENGNTAENKGGGISVWAGTFIMDGGTVKDNTCNNIGGAIYVRNDAHFQVKGDVQITDNRLLPIAPGSSPVVNNAYLDNTGVIEIIDDLGDDAIITITPTPGRTTPYVTFAEGVSTTDALSHFKLDNDEYRLILVGNQIEAYELYLWNEPSTWNGTIATNLNGELPNASSEVTIYRAVKIPNGCVAAANTITLGDYGEIVINNGGQLIHNNAVTATLQKSISAYTVPTNNGESKTDGWYTIASPVTDDLNSECVALGNYDLYLYNEPTHYWWNAEGNEHGFSTLSNGRGYLYANKEDVTLNFTGSMRSTTSANVSFPLSYTSGAGNLKGYNLVGNPFTRNLTSNDAIMVDGSPLTAYMYVSNGNEVVTATLAERPIQPGEGFFVQATGAGQDIVFNYEAPTSDGMSNASAFLRIEAGDDNFMDRAYIKFGDGNTLHKITINDNVPHLSLQQGKDDFASTTIKATQGEMPVCFKAAKNGSYSITVSPEGMEMDYLHLIDNLTGTDIDLLSAPTYTFTARNNDYASRFRLVYSVRHSSGSDTNNESFAFIANGRIILSGVENNATLQVIDVTGRIIHQGDATDCVSTSELVSGVYVLRLIQNSDAKTQKIVVD